MLSVVGTTAVTVPLGGDPGGGGAADLLSRLGTGASSGWLRHGEGLLGWGEAARIELPPGPDRFGRAQRQLAETFAALQVRDEVGLAGTGPVAFASFTFDPVASGSVLVVPRVVVGRRNGQAWLTTIGPPDGVGPAAAGPAAYPGLAAGPAAGPAVRWTGGTLPIPVWTDAVAAAVAAIRAGALRKVVLARDLHGSANAPVDVVGLLRRLAARFPACFTFAVDGLVGATPELLLRQRGRQVSSDVLAGSAPRGSGPGRDRLLGRRLERSAKDVDEHRIAVESVLAALGPVAADVRAAERPRLLRLSNIQHLATEVTATLRADAHPFTPLSALHPTASVCGLPTDAAFRLIGELEGMRRGRYSGPVGWLDTHGNADWGIALRCAEVAGERMRLFAGVGVVARSDPAAELRETELKFDPMRTALGAPAAVDCLYAHQ